MHASGDIASGSPVAQPEAAADARTLRNERHFATDHLMGDLKGRSVRGGAVTLSSQAIKFVLQMGSTVVLARLLLPSDFGLIAMVTAVTGFVAMFKDAGLSMATVQRKVITHDQVSTLFWINVALSAAVMFVVAALAPAIAAFYSEPRLVWVTLALAGTMLFGGFTVQHQALLRRQMRFKALAVVEIASMGGGIAVAIAMALMESGYWSLVGMVAGTALINAVLVWVLCDWRPGLPKRGSGTAAMLKFGGKLTGFNFLNYFTRNLDNVIVGAALGATSLGLYSKAYGLLLLPIRQVNSPVSAVVIPVLSRLQDDPNRFRRFYLKAVLLISSATFPIAAYIAIDAESFVQVILGDQWMGSVPVFQWLAPAAIMGGINVAPGWLCTVLDHNGRLVRWAAVCAPMMAIGFLVGVNFGVEGVAAAASFVWTSLYVWLIVWSCKDTPIQPCEILQAIGPALIATGCACLALVAFRRWIGIETSIVAIGIHSGVFAVTYAGSWMALADWRSLVRLMVESSSNGFGKSKGQ